jgi:hypothetical protein
MRLAILAVLAAGLIASGCGSAPERSGGVSTRPLDQAQLVVRRADGSFIEFPGRALVWCGPWNDEVTAQTIHAAALGDLPPKKSGWYSYWRLWAVAADIHPGAHFSFPLQSDYGNPRGVSIFVGDAATGNELNSTGEDSSGGIAFIEGSCDKGATVRFRVNAVIDSEFGDAEPVKMTGSFRGVVADPPAELR